LLNRRLFVNLTAFYVDWTNQQVSIASARAPANNTFIGNAAASTSKGFELEITAKPTDSLDLYGTMSLTDAKFDRFIDPALAGTDLATGQIATLPGSRSRSWRTGCSAPTSRATACRARPKWQAAAGGQYTGSIGMFGAESWYARADYFYRSRQFAESSNFAYVGDQHRVNLRLAWRARASPSPSGRTMCSTTGRRP
jgi:outer membrane receptor protein involved in Fe transport